MLQYLVVLAGTDPLVWRRIRVPGTYSFWDLHVAIQDAVGWHDSHLHEFRILDPRSGTVMTLGIPDGEGWEGGHVVPEWTEFPLDYTGGDALPIQYVYDFGDDWRHAVVFEGFEQVPGRRKLRPECLAGGGACPPEDSGGAHLYAELLAALADPKHPEHGDYKKLIDESIDPSFFSVTGVRFDDPQKRWHMAFNEDVDQDT